MHAGRFAIGLASEAGSAQTPTLMLGVGLLDMRDGNCILPGWSTVAAGAPRTWFMACS